MKYIIFTVVFSVLSSCTPPALYTAQDPRQSQIGGTNWAWYTDDSVYLVSGQPKYLARVIADTCGETYFFETGHYFTRRDSCGSNDAVVYHGTWFWPQGDSLSITSSGAEPTFQSFRFTGDTLQLSRTTQAATDSFNGIPVNFVRTYIKR